MLKVLNGFFWTVNNVVSYSFFCQIKHFDYALYRGRADFKNTIPNALNLHFLLVQKLQPLMYLFFFFIGPKCHQRLLFCCYTIVILFWNGCRMKHLWSHTKSHLICTNVFCFPKSACENPNNKWNVEKYLASAILQQYIPLAEMEKCFLFIFKFF